MAALCRTGTPFWGNDQSLIDMRTDAGVVERGGLENRCASDGTQGSNPCLSAIFAFVDEIVLETGGRVWPQTSRNLGISSTKLQGLFLLSS
jgi:hypothetical protein